MPARRVVSLLHRWTGLLLGLAVAFVGLTGSSVVFAPEIDRWLNPDLHFVERGETSAAVDDVLATAVAAHVGRPPTFVSMRFAPEPGRTHVILMKDGFGKDSGPFQEAFVDPWSGRLLGIRVTEDRFAGLLIGLHAHLLLGEHGPGETAVGLLGIVLLLFGASGLYLWWPRGRTKAAAFRIRRGRGNYWATYDTHKLVGAGLSVLMMLTALTGLVLVFPGYVRPPIKAVFDIRPPPPAPKSLADAGPGVAADAALKAALGVVPGGLPTAIQVPGAGNGSIQVRLREAGDTRMRYADGGVQVFVDRHSGAVLEVRRNDARPTGSRLLHEWVLPLHTGDIAGLVGRIAMLLAGIAPAVLVGTGFYLWSSRRTLRRRRRAAAACAGAAAPSGSPRHEHPDRAWRQSGVT